MEIGSTLNLFSEVTREIFGKFLPHKATLRNISLFSFIAYKDRTLLISHIAQKLCMLAKYETIRKRLTRLFSSSLERFRKFLISYMVAICFKVRGKYLRLILDYTRIPLINRDILVAAVPIGGRALPVYFEFLPSNQTSHFSQNRFEIEFLRRIKRIFKKHRIRKRVIIIWDRGFAKGFLFKNLSSGFYFLGRIRKNTGIIINGRREVIGKTLKVERCQMKYFKSVKYGITHRVPCSLVGIWKGGEKGPWWIVSNIFNQSKKKNRKEWKVIVELYRERFWIEQGFKDLKNGVDLKDLRFSKNIQWKMEKALIILMIGYGVYYGIGGSREGEARRFMSGKDKRLSYFRVGVLVVVNFLDVSLEEVEDFFKKYFSWREVNRLARLKVSLRC